MRHVERNPRHRTGQHPEPELLGLLALGESVASSEELGHLARCTGCAEDVEQLRAVAVIGRTTAGIGPLAEPPANVWRAISAEVELGDSVLPSAPDLPEPIAPGRAARGPTFLLAAILATALAIGAGLIVQLVRPGESETLAGATLEAFPGWEGAAGEAIVELRADGTREVTVTLTARAPDDGYREVWLISEDGTALISLGVLEGDSGTFVVPEAIDLGQYSLVDVSHEPLDGDPAHSGDSIVRGELA